MNVFKILTMLVPAAHELLPAVQSKASARRSESVGHFGRDWAVRGRAGFSLIELLVVIAVVAVLAALTIAVTGSVRQSADQVKNAEKLRNLGLASLAYASDNNGRLPLTVMVGTGARMTQGPVLYNTQTKNALSMLTNQWDDAAEDRPVWGMSDYLEGPDAFYGPLTPNLERHANRFHNYNDSPIAYLIGYIYYSLPGSVDTTNPPRAPLAPGLANDSMSSAGISTTPLFSDPTSTSWADNLMGGFTGDKVTVVRMDGSIASFDRSYIYSLASNDKVRALGDVLED